MAHARRRHYRVAQKATEAQFCQNEDNSRRNNVLLCLVAVILVLQLFTAVVKLIELFSDTEED